MVRSVRGRLNWKDDWGRLKTTVVDWIEKYDRGRLNWKDDWGRLNWKRLLRTTRDDWIKNDDWGRPTTTEWKRTKLKLRLRTTGDDHGRLNWKRLRTTKNGRGRLNWKGRPRVRDDHDTTEDAWGRSTTTELKKKRLRSIKDDRGRLNWKKTAVDACLKKDNWRRPKTTKDD